MALFYPHPTCRVTLLSQKRPVYMSKETFIHVKRERPTSERKGDSTGLPSSHPTMWRELALSLYKGGGVNSVTLLGSREPRSTCRVTLLSQKRPTYMSKETYMHVKRDTVARICSLTLYREARTHRMPEFIGHFPQISL